MCKDDIEVRGKKEGKQGLALYVNSRSSDRDVLRNPLHLARSVGNYRTIKALLQYGADSKAEDRTACTLYDLLDNLRDSSNALREIKALLEKASQHTR